MFSLEVVEVSTRSTYIWLPAPAPSLKWTEALSHQWLPGFASTPAACSWDQDCRPRYRGPKIYSKLRSNCGPWMRQHGWRSDGWAWMGKRGRTPWEPCNTNADTSGWSKVENWFKTRKWNLSSHLNFVQIHLWIYAERPRWWQQEIGRCWPMAARQDCGALQAGQAALNRSLDMHPFLGQNTQPITANAWNIS